MASRRDALPPSSDACISSSCDALSSSRFTFSPFRDEESEHRVALAAPPSARLSSEQAQASSPAMAPSFVEPASPPTSFPDSDDDASIHDEMETDISREDNADKNDSKSKKSGNNFVPKEGMTFASLEKFESLYYNFAVSEGYTVRIRRTTKFAHTDRIRYRQYVCSCAGFCEEKKTNVGLDVDQEKISRRTLTRRTGCLVNISISYKNGVWKVGKINKEHNHLLVSPNSRIHLKHPGGMPSVAKSLVEKFSEVDLPIGRVADIVNCDANINVSQRDC